MRTPLRRAPALVTGLLAVVAAVRPASAQLDTTDVPLPPAARLARLERFFGTYEHSNQYYAGLGPFEGTIHIGPAVKGWYVEIVIDTRYGPVDRELRLLTTWDETLGHYRVWRFETYPQTPPGTIEAAAWFEGDDFVMDWRDTRGPDGDLGIFRDRFRMEDRDRLLIVTDVDVDWADPVHLGDFRSRRVGR